MEPYAPAVTILCPASLGGLKHERSLDQPKKPGFYQQGGTHQGVPDHAGFLVFIHQITWNTIKYLILTFSETEELPNVWQSQLPVQQPGDPSAADLPDDHEQREHHGQPQVLWPAGLL